MIHGRPEYQFVREDFIPLKGAYDFYRRTVEAEIDQPRYEATDDGVGLAFKMMALIGYNLGIFISLSKAMDGLERIIK